MNTPFWSPPHQRYRGALPEKVDVLVIGGGITGVSLLYHLAHRGIHAVLFERRHLASGASGRNAGFLLAGVADNYAAAVRAFGRDRAREIWTLTLENHDALAAAVRNQDVGHNRCGTVILAADDGEARELEESAQLLVEDGFRAHWDGKALFNPRDGEVNPASLVGALARLAPAGEIHEGIEVTSLQPYGRGVYVHVRDETCEAGVVLLATNAYTPQLVPSVRITPRRAQMMATAPLDHVVCERPTYSNRGYRYWRQLESGVLLVGGWRDTAIDTEVGYDEQPTAAIQERLDAHAAKLGADRPITHRWAGTMGFTETGLPLVGLVDGMKNVYVCAGYNGHGMGFAFISAKKLAGML